jgi:copper(I)-binding protein
MFASFFRRLAVGLTLSVACISLMTQASAHEMSIGDIVIEHPYATPTPPGLKTGGGYFKAIKNKGDQSDQLISVKTPVAASVEMHQMSMEGDIMRMKEVSAIEIPAKGQVELRHGGHASYHLMLFGLKAPLKDGDRFPLTLKFKRAGEKEVMVWVQTPKTMQADPQHTGHAGHAGHTGN